MSMADEILCDCGHPLEDHDAAGCSCVAYQEDHFILWCTCDRWPEARSEETEGSTAR